MSSLSANERIARNTILLYLRMIFSTIVSLYTSRAILSVLGEEDFGIYNVVAGVVVLFSFLTNAMTNSTQRFLNYSLGIDDKNDVAKVFNTSMLAHFTILGVVLFLAETVGLWFILTKLNIPPERHIASIWVYQASVFATLINIVVIPYRASIIAIERMDIFAYISILDIVLKLVIVLILPLFTCDYLILYSLLLTAISFISYFLYRYVCRKNINFTHFCFLWDKNRFVEQISFSVWYLFGGMATVSSKQGINILINIFFSVTVNAAVGIANQVRAAIFSFVSSFQTAFNPQLVKLYASGDYNSLCSLLYRSSKFSYYLLFVISLPVVVFCEDILAIWLIKVPQYAVVFTQIVIITSFAEALSAPLWTAIGAVGKIKKYQMWVSLIILLDLPLVYFCFKLGYSPIWAFIINLVTSTIAYVYRLIYIKKYVRYSLKLYIVRVALPCLLVTVISVPISLLLHRVSCSLLQVIGAICLTVCIICIIIYSLGLDKTERNFLIQNIVKKTGVRKI